MAAPFLQEVELGKRLKLPKSIKRQSLNEMAAFVAGEAGQSEPKNVESRVWRPSAWEPPVEGVVGNVHYRRKSCALHGTFATLACHSCKSGGARFWRVEVEKVMVF